MSDLPGVSERRLSPRFVAVLLPSVVVVPVVVVLVVLLWVADPPNLAPLLLIPLGVLLASRMIMYVAVRRREAGVVIDHRGVTWVATSSTVPWLVVESLRVTRVGRGWAVLGLYGTVGLVDRGHTALHVINLKYVRATAEEVLDAIAQYAPQLVDRPVA